MAHKLLGFEMLGFGIVKFRKEIFRERPFLWSVVLRLLFVMAIIVICYTTLSSLPRYDIMRLGDAMWQYMMMADALCGALLRFHHDSELVYGFQRARNTSKGIKKCYQLSSL
ncbi:hypothetical protein M7I_0170 [Glarea lozoyensis 74030]|uniref:Uncharacterized protein n=1 Tax=Glarea lozoyensis (strain ATCC 74030 / MF5533) TaxID=1104152 RepID=H0ECM7_GLAL7|nr:hypothetical protein M7I_0170 [Glarea lozoyensis 74030]